MALISGCDSRAPSTPASTSHSQIPATPITTIALLQDLLAPRSVEATVRELVTDADTAALLNRMTAAMQENKEWFVDYVKKYGGTGEPLPYNEKLGLTEAEYQRVLKVQFQALPAHQAPLAFTHDAKKNLVLTASGDIEPLSGLAFQFPSGRVHTPFGDVESPAATRTDDYLGLGPLEGFRWHFDNLADDLSKGATMTLTVGSLERGGDGILNYQAKQVLNQVPVADIRIVVTFPQTQK